MGAPQITLIVLWSLSLGISMSRHGEPKKGKENFVSSIISVAIVSTILWWGGFWTGR